MQRAASFARISAAVVSFSYMIILLPHFAGITPQHFSSGWFLGGIAIALAWIPILLFTIRLGKDGEERAVALSFLPLVLFAAYFGALLVSAY